MNSPIITGTGIVKRYGTNTVLDHADEDVWGGLPNVILAEEWRERALVPFEWLGEE